MFSFRDTALVLAVVAMVAAAALATDFALTRMIAKSSSLEAGRILRLAERPNPREIPVFGASKAASNYLPDVLGSNVYSYGSAEASQDVSNYLIAMTLEQDSRQPIIVDFVHFRSTKIGDARNFIPVADRPDTRKLLQQAGEWRWFHAVPGLRYFGSWDFYIAGLLTDRKSETVSVRRGHAYHLREPQWNAETFRVAVEKRLRTPTIWDTAPRQIDQLSRLMKRAPQRTFVLVLSPLHHSFMAHATGEPAFRTVLAELQSSHPNMKVIDFTRVPYPDWMFGDTAHLNHAGATQFSRDLRTELKRRRIL